MHERRKPLSSKTGRMNNLGPSPVTVFAADHVDEAAVWKTGCVLQCPQDREIEVTAAWSLRIVEKASHFPGRRLRVEAAYDIEHVVGASPGSENGKAAGHAGWSSSRSGRG